MSMSTFELIANDIVTGIATSADRIRDFGYEEDIEKSLSGIYSMFVSWLIGYEEERQTDLGRGTSFTKTLIQNLPDHDDPSWESYIMPAPSTTLKKRCMDLWGVRIAFTHGNGNIDRILDQKVKRWAENIDIRGVRLEDRRLIVNGGISHYAIRTIVQVQDVLK